MEEQFQGGVMERLGTRKGQLKNMEPDGKGRVRLDYLIPARGLIGFQTEFRTVTAGTGLLFHVFDHYGPRAEGAIAKRQNGVMISNGTGSAPAYSLVGLQERGRLLIDEGAQIYEGQLVGIHAKDNDLTVNALRAKQMTNIRASGKDENVQLTPPIKHVAGAGAGIHRGRRTGRSHAEGHPPAQEAPDRKRPQEGLAAGGVASRSRRRRPTSGLPCATILLTFGVALTTEPRLPNAVITSSSLHCSAPSSLPWPFAPGVTGAVGLALVALPGAYMLLRVGDATESLKHSPPPGARGTDR